jgi:membrane protein YdbS with pleckstrin-like domain
MNEARQPSWNREFDPFAITRPAPVLMTYYALVSLLAGPAFVFALVPLACKYLTLRYRFDEKGISMSHGVLFKRETLVTYRRIQDIHLTHNIVQRWLGLATVSIQTASGSSGAEIAIEGILEAESIRDFLYQRMRGARGLDQQAATGFAESDLPVPFDVVNDDPNNTSADEATALLRDIRDALVTLSKRREGRP